MNYVLKLFSTGAVRQTPERIIKRITEEVDSSKRNFVELGSGKGEITASIIKKLPRNAKINYYAFEIEESFNTDLKEQFPKINVINESAFSFNDKIPSDIKIDYFLCSMPLSFYSNEEIQSLLESMKNRLSNGGKIIILFHAAWLKKLLKSCLPGAESYSYLSFPPYFLIIYTDS